LTFLTYLNQLESETISRIEIVIKLAQIQTTIVLSIGSRLAGDRCECKFPVDCKKGALFKRTQ